MNAAFGPRAGGLRLMRWLIVAVSLGTAVNSATTVLLFRANAARVQQIQAERALSSFRFCSETNARHDATLEELDRLVAGLPRAQRVRARRGQAGTVALIEALAPRRDCRALVKRQVNTK
jgi:hypothetical protein